MKSIKIQKVEFGCVSIPTKKGGTVATITVYVTPMNLDRSYPITIQIPKRFFANSGAYKNKKRYNIEDKIIKKWNQFCREHNITLQDAFTLDGAL